MAIFTMTSSGFHDAAIYDIVGVPTAADTVINNNLTLTIGANKSASFDLQMTGTDDVIRAVFTVEAGATYKQGATAAVINDFSIINFSANSILDLNGLAFNPVGGTVYATRGIAVNQINLLGTLDNPAVIMSSVVGAGTFGVAGNWKITANYFAFKNTGTVSLQGGYYIGPELNIANGSIHVMAEFFIGGYRENSENWRMENVDFYGTSATQYMGKIECRAQQSTSPITGTTICKNVTIHCTSFDTTGLYANSIRDAVRLSGHGLTVDSFIFKDIFLEDLGYNGILYQNCMLNGEAGNAKTGTVWANNYCYTTKDNPHNFTQCMETFNDNVTENEYLDAYTDGGDAYIFPANGFSANRNLFIDHKTGVAFNMLHGSRDGVMDILHNTCVSYAQKIGGVYYGQLWRRESIGSKAATGILNIRSNLASNLNTLSLGAALYGSETTPTVSLIDLLSHNGLDGFETDYAEVDLTGLIANTDIIDQPANFFDPTRTLSTWNQNFGSGTNSGQDAVTHLLKANGFNTTTLQQDSTIAVAQRPSDAVSWVRDGYKIGNPIYNNAGHDGATIGALAYVTPAAISSAPADLVDGETGNTISVTGFGGSINSVVLSDLQGAGHSVDLSASIVDLGAGNYTFDSPNVLSNTATVSGTPFSTDYWTHLLTVSDGTSVATAALTYSPSVGFKVVDFNESISLAEGSLLSGSTGIQQSITGIAFGNPTVLTLDTIGFVDQQDVTIYDTNVTPDINGSLSTPNSYVLTIVDAVTATIPVNSTAVTDGTGRLITGGEREHGQFVYPITANLKVTRSGMLTIDITTSQNVRVFNVGDSKYYNIGITA